MIKSITAYEVDGKKFFSYDTAFEYNKTLNKYKNLLCYVDPADAMLKYIEYVTPYLTSGFEQLIERAKENFSTRTPLYPSWTLDKLLCDSLQPNYDDLYEIYNQLKYKYIEKYGVDNKK